MTLDQLLVLAADGSLGVVVYWLLEHPLKEWYSQFTEPDIKRWVAASFAVVLAVAAWGVGVALEVFALPTGDWRAWATEIANVAIGAATAFTAATLTHTKVLRARRS